MHPKKADLLERFKDYEVALLNLTEEWAAYFAGSQRALLNPDMLEPFWGPVRRELGLHYSRVLEIPDENFDIPLEWQPIVATFARRDPKKAVA